MHVLLVLLNEKEEAQFNILQEGFLKRYSLVAPAFIKYYRDNYAGRELGYVLHCKTEANIFVESFHHKLKTFLIEGRKKKLMI